MDDAYFMEMALNLALQAEGFTSPNPMVGALVVKDGIVVGSGYHQAVGGAHAEVNAIAAAAERAQGATLYVSLEPCNHSGRTPPCTRKIIEAGIKRVVMAMRDPNDEVVGGGAEFLQRQGIQVTVGVHEDRAKKLNEAFIKYVRTKRPFVIAKCAATLDGRIATRSGDSRWVTGEPAREFVHRLRHAVDAVMVGINTIRADNPNLTTRLKDRQSKDPVRVILDTRLNISLDAKVLRQVSAAGTILVAGQPAPKDKKSALEQIGARVLEAPLRNDWIDLERLMEQLGGMQLCSLLIEGGSRVLGSAFTSRIVDKVYFFYAPKILGGDDGVPICSGPGPASISDCIAVKDIRVRRLGEDVLIEGYIR